MTMKSKLGALVAVPALAVLTACGSGGAQPEAQPLSPDMEATLTIWTYDQAERDNLIQQEMFEKLYPNVEFDVVFIPQEQFANKVIASATSQTGPDILWINPAYTQAFADAGVVYDLTDNWAGYEDADQFPESVVNKANGSIYSVQTYSNLNALWYNQTILDSLGLEVPTTLDELEDALIAATDAGHLGLEIPGTPGIEGEWISKPFFTGYGVDDYAELGEPGTQEMFERLSGWVSDGLINKADLNLSQGDGVKRFLEGNTAFFVGGNWLLSEGDTATFDWGVVPMPAGPDGPGIVYLGGQAEAVGAFSTNPALAWEFLRTTWLSKEFETTTLGFGSIPSRADALPSDASQQITAYAEAIAAGVPISSDTANTLLVGNLWSGVLAGQSSPADGAKTAADIAKTAK